MADRKIEDDLTCESMRPARCNLTNTVIIPSSSYRAEKSLVYDLTNHAAGLRLTFRDFTNNFRDKIDVEVFVKIQEMFSQMIYRSSDCMIEAADRLRMIEFILDQKLPSRKVIEARFTGSEEPKY